MVQSKLLCFSELYACADLEGDRGSGPPPPPPPLKNHKNIGFLSTSVKSHSDEPAINVGLSSSHQRNAIKWRFAGGTMVARL